MLGLQSIVEEQCGKCYANITSPLISNRHRRNFKLAHLRDQSHPFIISLRQALQSEDDPFTTHFLISFTVLNYSHDEFVLFSLILLVNAHRIAVRSTLERAENTHFLRRSLNIPRLFFKCATTSK